MAKRLASHTYLCLYAKITWGYIGIDTCIGIDRSDTNPHLCIGFYASV